MLPMIANTIAEFCNTLSNFVIAHMSEGFTILAAIILSLVALQHLDTARENKKYKESLESISAESSANFLAIQYARGDIKL